MEWRGLAEWNEGGLSMRVSRRTFVFSIAALATAPPAELLSRTTEDTSRKPLTDNEKAILADMCEQIIPKDEFPGAKEAGVVEFITRTLREAHPDWIVIYREGLKSCQLSSLELHSKVFVEIPFEEQTELMRKMERGALSVLNWPGIGSSEFFSMVRSHTMQGYYSHPKWGGNRDKASWKMIGYDDWWV